MLLERANLIHSYIRSDYFTPPSMTPAAVKKLVERRNERFCKAVDESVFPILSFQIFPIRVVDYFYRLILATPSSDNPVTLVQAAGRDHVPVNPTSTPGSSAKAKSEDMTIPGPQDRLTIDSVISEIKEQEWYKEQIVERRTTAPKDAQIGRYIFCAFMTLYGKSLRHAQDNLIRPFLTPL
jgi:DEAD/DEAH box helicase domain-containing protein